jgi:hypothetical protein
MQAMHAPKGGATIGGKKFKGGEFIPAEVIQTATKEEKSRLEGRTGDRKDASSGLKLKPLKSRNFDGTPKTLRTKLSKSDTGKLGESIAVEWLKSQGFKDARVMNLDRNNFPVDLIQDHEVYEVKAGLISNGKDAQKWRLTIGEPGKKEKEWLKTASPEDKARWNARKAEMIVERKAEVVRELSKRVGTKVRLRTLTMVIDPDTNRADIHVFDGSHPIIRWTSGLSNNAYKETVEYA